MCHTVNFKDYMFVRIAVNDDLCTLISDYIHLEGNADSMYKLKSITELGDDVEIPPPPIAPVYPPELPKGINFIIAFLYTYLL